MMKLIDKWLLDDMWFENHGFEKGKLFESGLLYEVTETYSCNGDVCDRERDIHHCGDRISRVYGNVGRSRQGNYWSKEETEKFWPPGTIKQGDETMKTMFVAPESTIGAQKMPLITIEGSLAVRLDVDLSTFPDQAIREDAFQCGWLEVSPYWREEAYRLVVEAGVLRYVAV